MDNVCFGLGTTDQGHTIRPDSSRTLIISSASPTLQVVR